MILSLIVAMARNRAIGKNNQLLWHLSSDLKRFKSLTTGHTILMGRKTFDSLPNGALPNRRNIVVSRQLDLELPNAEVFLSIEEALEVLKTSEDEIFVIGGGTIYQALYPQADKIYLTEVDATFEDADTFFPQIEQKDWKLTYLEEVGIDERNPLTSTYSILERIKN